MLDYKPEQLWPLFEKLPEDLKETIFSEKTADSISDIYVKNEIKEEKISDITKYISYVLLGILTPQEFQKSLEEDIKLDKELAEKVNWEISRLIFLPVKPSLEKLYREEIVALKKEGVAPKKTAPGKEKVSTRDVYREPIE